MNIGEKIYCKRKLKGYSQEKLAELCGVSRQTVYKWESSFVQPTQDNLKVLCGLLDVKLEYFFDEISVPDVVLSKENIVATTAVNKTNKRIIMWTIINAIILFFMSFATVCIGFISLTTNPGDVVVYNFYIDPSVFYIMACLSFLDLCAEVYLIVNAILNHKRNAKITKS